MSPEERLIDRLLTVFGEPKVDNPSGYLDEFAKALRGYDAEILEAAGDAVIRECKFWPRPAEVRDHCESEGHRILLRRSDTRPKTGQSSEFSRNDASPETKARVDALVSDFKAMVASRQIEKAPEEKWRDVSRPAFERMQRESPNGGLHRLTPQSRRMMGDRDD